MNAHSRCGWLLFAALVSSGVWAGEDELPPITTGKWADSYDSHFRKYAKRYFGPYFDWRWFKAQAVVESNLRPDATSPRGAVGLMQLLPSTFAEIKELNPHFVNLKEPRWNIAAGIYYDRALYRKWGLPSEQDRLYLAFASYNAGFVRMRRLYRQTPGTVKSWEQVEGRAPEETRDYVQRIRKLMDSDSPRPQSRLRGIAGVLRLGGDS